MMSVIGLSVTLLILGFIVGIVDKAKEKKTEELAVEQSSTNEKDAVWQYTPKDEKEGRDDLEDETVSNQLKSDADTTEDPTKNYLKVPDDAPKNPRQIDMFSQKYLKETNALAKDFVTKFHEFDRENPTDYLDTVEGVLVQSHIDYLRKSKAEKIEGMKDVEDIVSRKVLSVEIKEPAAPTLIAISWDGVVVSDVVDNNGQTRTDTDVYSMMFEKDSNGQFQVTDYYLNYDQKR